MRTLGVKGMRLVGTIAVPSVLPNILQGMSTACVALMVAEMIGVESELGWYIT